MIKYKVGSDIVAVNMSMEDFANSVSYAAAYVKTIVGIGNNAAWAATLEALDHLRQHPNFRHMVKREFNFAIVEFKAYEQRLIHTTNNRLFHVTDMAPEYRKRYGDITDREYYEYWAASGTTAYYREHQWVTSLWNKFRLSLIAHHVPNEDIVAWGMTADACLKTALSIYENSLLVAERENGVPMTVLRAIFGSLSIASVERRWDRAMMMLEPLTAGYELTPTEQKNIQNGVDQLSDAWSSCATLRQSLAETTEAYEEVFRTKGEMKKALRVIGEIYEE